MITRLGWAFAFFGFPVGRVTLARGERPGTRPLEPTPAGAPGRTSP